MGTLLQQELSWLNFTIFSIWGIVMLLLVLGLLPTRWWWSFAAQKQDLPSQGKARGRSDAPVMATSR